MAIVATNPCCIGTIIPTEDVVPGLTCEVSVGIGDTVLTKQDLIDSDFSGVVSTYYVVGETTAGDGYEGHFNRIPGDQSLNVAANPSESEWVAPSTDRTGLSGAWKRETNRGIEGLTASVDDLNQLNGNLFTGNIFVEKAGPNIVLKDDSLSNATVAFFDSATPRAKLSWNRGSDSLEVVQFDTDGLTEATKITLSEAGVVNVSIGTFQVGGIDVATVNTNWLLSDITDITANNAEVNVLSGIPGTLTSTELGYVDGVTSPLQGQIDLKSPLDSPAFTASVTLDGVSVATVNTNWLTTDITDLTASATDINQLGGEKIRAQETTLAALIARTFPASSESVYVNGRTSDGDGYQGSFIAVSGDQSANVTADTLQGIWVAPSSDPTGASGAWKRVYDDVVLDKWFGPTQDAARIQSAIALSDTYVRLEPNVIYAMTAININKDVMIDLNGATLQGAALANVGVVAQNSNVFIENGTLDNVWLGWSGSGVTAGGVKNCTFINETYSSTTAISGATGIVIDGNTFIGESRGALGTSFFPTFQVTTGAGSCKYINNRCSNVVSGVTWDGIDVLSDYFICSGNEFIDMQFYAMKFDVGNYVVFENNFVKNCRHGVFYEAIDALGVAITRDAGQQLVVRDNTFININNLDGLVPDPGTSSGTACLYVSAADNPYVRALFTGNYMDNCEAGVQRMCGHLIVSDNHFYNGVSLVMGQYEGSSGIKAGNIKIINNLIDTTRVPSDTVVNDWESEPITASVWVPNFIGVVNWTDSIDIKDNTFVNYHTNAIQIPRISGTFPNIEIDNNLFVTGVNSVNHINISGAARLQITNNKSDGTPSGTEVKLVNLIRFAQTAVYENNDWQRVAVAPTTGNHKEGEVWRNTTLAAGGFRDFICITAGTPGTWKGFGQIAV